MDRSLSDIAKEIIDLGKFSLLFGRVERATLHEDGKRPETDTDHTVMLGLVAWSIADRFYADLDSGRIAKFALIHDLVEAYAGDTPTLNISEQEKDNKKAREHAALQRIKREFSASFPNLPAMIELYEKRELPEARFVKAVDKVIPKITHILNQGATLKTTGISVSEARNTYQQQERDMQGYAADFPELLEIRRVLVEQMISLAHSQAATSSY
jgi:putative hydrolase of HD superfamily